MKKIVLLFFLAIILVSCSKNKCWILSDCIGNDIQSYCGSERDVKAQCASIGTPTCPCSYRQR